MSCFFYHVVFSIDGAANSCPPGPWNCWQRNIPGIDCSHFQSPASHLRGPALPRGPRLPLHVLSHPANGECHTSSFLLKPLTSPRSSLSANFVFYFTKRTAITATSLPRRCWLGLPYPTCADFVLSPNSRPSIQKSLPAPNPTSSTFSIYWMTLIRIKTHCKIFHFEGKKTFLNSIPLQLLLRF